MLDQVIKARLVNSSDFHRRRVQSDVSRRSQIITYLMENKEVDRDRLVLMVRHPRQLVMDMLYDMTEAGVLIVERRGGSLLYRLSR